MVRLLLEFPFVIVFLIIGKLANSYMITNHHRTGHKFSCQGQKDLLQEVTSLAKWAPFISVETQTPSIVIDEKIKLTTDFLQQLGGNEYLQLGLFWRQGMRNELNDFNFQLMKSRYLSSNTKVLLEWNVTFIPQSVTAIAWFGKVGELGLHSFVN